MEFTLPLPKQLDRNGILLKQWSSFSQRFHCYRNSSSSNGPGFETDSILLFSAQQHMNSIGESLQKYNLDSLKLSRILEAVEQICLPYFLLLFERFRYFTLEQDTFETLSDFVNVMRKQVDLCEFGDTKDSIVTNSLVNGESFRQSLQDTSRPCFDDAVNVCSDLCDKSVASDNNVTSVSSLVSSATLVTVPGVLAVPDLASGGTPEPNTASYRMVSKPSNTTSTGVAVSKKRARVKKKSNISRARTEKNIYVVPFSNGNKELVSQVDDVKTEGNSGGGKHRAKIERKLAPMKQPSFLCFSCDCEYASRKSFHRHLQSKHVDCSEYYCKHCHIIFHNRRECISHCMGHTTVPSSEPRKVVESTEYLCWYCEERVLNLEDYKKHCSTHSAIRVFYCDLCQRKTHTQQRMLGHLKGHLIPRYRCEICANCFGRAELFTAHLETHAAQPVHQCQVCSKNFVSSDRLQSHMRTHSEEKRFMCEICGKSYRQKISLECHKRAHTGEKPYKCDVCGNKFTTFKHLKEHKRMHSDKRPYVCEVCGKSFRYSSNLARHCNGHTGKRAFGCEVCGKTFIYSEGLRDHRKAGRCPGRKHDGVIRRRSRAQRTKAASSSDNNTLQANHSHSTSRYTVDRLFSELVVGQFMCKN